MCSFVVAMSTTTTTLKIGITGGIGSGKTTVCRLFETLGVPVYYADERAKWLMVNDEALIVGIKALFGEAAYQPDGSLNRAYIAERAFHNEPLLEQLNGLVHPAVGRDSLVWFSEHQQSPYVLKEAALLFESGSYRQLDAIIVVAAPEELRIERVMRRDGVSREAVLARIRRQWPQEEKIHLADYVIHNDGQSSLIRQVWELHKRITVDGRR